jgi:hypothetical protein
MRPSGPPGSRGAPIPIPDPRPMNVLFEDDGQLKAGAVLADQGTSLQVEASSGRRLKVKAANVLLRFASPGAGEALAQAATLAGALDPQFLWDVSGADEFAFYPAWGGPLSVIGFASVAWVLVRLPRKIDNKAK